MTAYKKALVLENLRLAYWTASKYKNCGIELEELQGVALVGLVEAADKYIPTKSSFSTFAVRVISNEIMERWRRERKHLGTVSLDGEVITSQDGDKVSLLELLPSQERGFERIEASHIVLPLFQCRKLREIERKAVYLTICKEMKQQEAGEHLNVAQSYVSRCVKSGLRKMRDCYPEEREEKLCR